MTKISLGNKQIHTWKNPANILIQYKKKMNVEYKKQISKMA